MCNILQRVTLHPSNNYLIQCTCILFNDDNDDDDGDNDDDDAGG